MISIRIFVQCVYSYRNEVEARTVRAGGCVVKSGQLVVWLSFRPVDQRVAGSIPDSTNFLTNSSGQATNALVFLLTKP